MYICMCVPFLRIKVKLQFTRPNENGSGIKVKIAAVKLSNVLSGSKLRKKS